MFSDHRRLRAAVAFERRTAVTDWRPRKIAVVPLSSDAPVALIAAVIARVWTTVKRQEVAVFDPSATGQSARSLRAGSDVGRLLDLMDVDSATVPRKEIDDYLSFPADGPIALLALGIGDPSLAQFEVQLTCDVLARRFRSTITVIDPTVADDLMQPALRKVTHVVGVSPDTVPPGWLWTGQHPLSRFRDAGRLTVVTLGAHDERDTVQFPNVVDLTPALADMNLTRDAWSWSPPPDYRLLGPAGSIAMLRLAQTLFTDHLES
ncbi:MAG: hypothetical protein WBA38_18210 [Gordonia sp. (in: high G+C Gram-positive bacteria)]|uniref:hypothetical protein n=1 Tax=Gordonia sp. (in: high G+C Gram-positive bacteria) TaxID=84139 RepID=UPI003C753F3D